MTAVNYIQSNLDVRKILDYYNFRSISESGEMIRACCAIHGGDNPSAFVWNKTNNLWYCHTKDCGGGDVFNLIEKMESIPFTAAVEKAAYILGLDISDMSIDLDVNRLNIEQKKWLASKLKEKHENKLYTLPYTKYYEDHPLFSRFDKYTVGYFNAMFCNLFPTDSAMLKNKLVIPIFEGTRLIGASLRALDDTYPKWIHQPKHIKLQGVLYNLGNIVEQIERGEVTEIILVEGIFDVWAYHEIKIDNVVAIFGSNLSTEQQELLLSYPVDLTLSFDGDKAGKKCTLSTASALRNKVTLRKIDMPEGKDPADLSKDELLSAYLNRQII